MAYNITIMSKPANQLTAVLTVLFHMATIAAIANAAISVRRKKRSASKEEQRQDIFEDFHRQTAKILSELDTFGCTAGAVCEAARLPGRNRTHEQHIMSSIFSLGKAQVPQFSDLDKPEGKFAYAAFLGSTSKDNPKICKQAFPRCPLPMEHVLKQMVESMSDGGAGCVAGLEGYTNLIDELSGREKDDTNVELDFSEEQDGDFSEF